MKTQTALLVAVVGICAFVVAEIRKRDGPRASPAQVASYVKSRAKVKVELAAPTDLAPRQRAIDPELDRDIKRTIDVELNRAIGRAVSNASESHREHRGSQ